VQVRSELGRALEFFYHGRVQWTLRTLPDARPVIEYFNAQVPEKIEENAVQVLIDAGDLDDPLGVEVLHSLTKTVGVSLEDAQVYVKGLEARRVLRFDRGPAPNESSGMEPSRRLGRWVRCAPSNPAGHESEGK
jgi:hypothetical protein